MTSATSVRVPASYTPDTSRAPDSAAAEPRWHPAALIAFRICVVYFAIYVLITQMLASLLPVPSWELPELGMFRPFSTAVVWVGAHVLHTSNPVTIHPSGSGDRLFDYVQAFTLLLVAAVVTAIWSYAARRRTNHDRLYAWFRVFIRFALGTTFLGYGFAKVIPLQMPVTDLRRLVEPFGNFSPMGVLWTSIGSAPAYEIFVGCAEIAGAVLVMIPRTATLGALVCLMDATEVFMLNMTYDVPVKLFSFTLAVMSLVILAPNVRRLWNLLVLHRAERIRAEPELGSSPRSRRGITIAQFGFALYAVGVNATGAWTSWHQYGGAAPRSPLYGVWAVSGVTVDGVDHPALLTDTTRWRHAIFQSPMFMLVQRMNDSIRGYGTKIDTIAKSIQLSSADTAHPKSTLRYQRPDRSRLLLDGTLEGHSVHMELAYRDPASFLVRKRGFRWVQEFPFNR